MTAATPPAASAAAAPHLGVIGLGLIGGSLALAAKQSGWRVSAYNRTQATAAAAQQQGDIHHAAPAIAALAQECDIICIATPMQTYDSIFAQLAPALSPKTTITDGGSVKRHAIAAARRHLSAAALARFVPAHPIAGKEESGYRAASADLFRGCTTLLCPHDTAAPNAIAAATTLWQTAGARVRHIGADAHDQQLARISHLPHLLAFALVSAIERQPEHETLLQLAAGGFRDFTRIASSHPEMWRDICAANADNLQDAITALQTELAQFADHLKNQNADALMQRFIAARELRRRWITTLEQ